MSNDKEQHSLKSDHCGYTDRQQASYTSKLPNECNCEPAFNFQYCQPLFNPWVRNKLSMSVGKGGLVAYVRVDKAESSTQEQVREIEQYCLKHGYKIQHIFFDCGVPGKGLQEALNSLDECAGVIATNLDRFVDYRQEKLRQVRPLLHHFLSHTDKHLISIEEGIDTRSPAGQLIAMEVMSDVKGTV